jgi:hypothetical protein
MRYTNTTLKNMFSTVGVAIQKLIGVGGGVGGVRFSQYATAFEPADRCIYA